MSFSTTKFFLAALAAGSSATALPSMAGGSWGKPSYSSSNCSNPSSTFPIIPVTPIETSIVPSLVAQLKTAGTVVDRFKDLLVGSDGELLGAEDVRTRTVFDFNSRDVPAKGATGGAIALANIDSFPILTNLGISVAMGFLGPCGLNTPHTHPRATEFLTLIDGDQLESGFILENGFADANGVPFEVRSTVSRNQGTVFPVGSNHWQFNPTCKNATFVAALSSEDPGVSQIAQNFFNLNGEVIEATLGFPESINGENLAQFKQHIPANVAQIVQNCAAKCGYKY